jgi:hypothetical protein
LARVRWRRREPGRAYSKRAPEAALHDISVQGGGSNVITFFSCGQPGCRRNLRTPAFYLEPRLTQRTFSSDFAWGKSPWGTPTNVLPATAATCTSDVTMRLRKPNQR